MTPETGFAPRKDLTSPGTVTCEERNEIMSNKGDHRDASKRHDKPITKPKPHDKSSKADVVAGEQPLADDETTRGGIEGAVGGGQSGQGGG